MGRKLSEICSVLHKLCNLEMKYALYMSKMLTFSYDVSRSV